MKTTPSPAAGASAQPRRKVVPEYADALKLFTVLFRAQAALAEKSRESVARHGLTPAEFSVMEALYHRGPLLLGEVGSKILVSSGGITYLVDRLAGRGLVERRECAEDRRARYAALTGKGAELMDRIFPEHARCLARSMEALSPAELREAARLVKALGKGARVASDCRDSGTEA